jgi:hypothetical protein
MEERFFTSKQAAQIAGCTLRQLQYWRESGVVVPAIAETGTGRVFTTLRKFGGVGGDGLLAVGGFYV